MGQGPWDKGQGLWAKAHGPWAKPHGPGPIGQATWARAPMGQAPWAKPHGPGPMGPGLGIFLFSQTSAWFAHITPRLS